MVTFAAATNTTSTIPTRAPAQRRVDHFVAITCSNPNDSCDLDNDDCRSHAQLVSPSRDPIESYNPYLYVFSSPFVLRDPLGLFPACSANTCTRWGPHNTNEGVYALNVSVTGSKCHGSGCCGSGSGDAFIELTYVEYNGDATHNLARTEFIPGNMAVRGGASECSVLQSINTGKHADGTTTSEVVIKMKCPINCDDKCNCIDPSVTMEVLCPKYFLIDPTEGTNLPAWAGLCNFFQSNSGSASLVKTGSCGFSGCKATASSAWKSWKMKWGQNPNWVDDCGWEPSRSQFKSDTAFYEALEAWYVCSGYKRQAIPWIPNCTAAEKQKIRLLGAQL